MGLVGFQIRPVSGLEVVDFGGLNGFSPAQNPLKEVGRFAPHHFKLVLVGPGWGSLYLKHSCFPVRKPAGFENQTVPVPDLPTPGF